MSMIEVCYEVKDSVDFLVGAEGFVLNTGWPYHRILEALKEKANLPRVLAPNIVERYISYYNDYELAGASTDQSACDLGDVFDGLIDSVKRLSRSLQDGLDHPAIKNAILLAHWEAQSYKAEQYTDLYDFCDRLQIRCIKQPIVFEAWRKEGTYSVKPDFLKEENETKLSKVAKGVMKALLMKVKNKKNLTTAESVIKACGEVKGAIEENRKHVVLKSCYSGPAFQHSHGLSVYFPWADSEFLHVSPEEEALLGKCKDQPSPPRDAILAKYRSLGFAKATGWDKFLEKYVEVTRRGRRHQEDNLDPTTRNPKDPERIEPPNVTPAVGISPLLVRDVRPYNKGADLVPGSMKNPPDGFYQDKC
jgi:hypothetical protein